MRGTYEATQESQSAPSSLPEPYRMVPRWGFLLS